MTNLTQLTWVEWPFPDQGIGRWSAHVKLPGEDKTACGITTTLGKGAKEVGVYLENERPQSLRCCLTCLRLRRVIADRVRLAAWEKAK